MPVPGVLDPRIGLTRSAIRAIGASAVIHLPKESDVRMRLATPCDRRARPARERLRVWDGRLIALFCACCATSAQASCPDPTTFTGNVCSRLSDTWNDGQGELLVPFHTYHLRFAYTQEKIDSFVENTWGLGYGRSRYDAQGNWHSLYAMGFRDSHGKFEPVLGYAYQWMWGEAKGAHAGLGYTVLLTARSDIGHYTPIPGVLPIASLGYGRGGLSMAYVPGGKGNGNVIFLWGRFAF
ncbi:lipid IV(A) palmitoyltransferase PagP [Accumulibacter sp.]|uniref:lipid IV(A) palmitoyltransferase PagP n=2 Tax=Accumulibacter sp. TaxID=2053492 RepID=UPI00287A8F2D|nr:lipid IV(A) palmitoyltransferase PagP [Accumulibacter sp.]MDS4055560.1 lipid IV(A) palmitoyltransferase PagP [Accumulibacter sp.]